MAQPKSQSPQQELVLAAAPAGVAKIPAGTPLTRLNYYDGLSLRASHLGAEQRYVRALAGFANQGLGAGLVHGFSAELEAEGDTLAVRAGLAFDGEGRTLFLPVDVKVGVQELIEKSSAAAAGATGGGLLVGGDFGDCTVAAVGGGTSLPVAEGSLYVISICHIEALCGQEDVYGRLCEKACATDVARPWLVEGVVLRALPLQLTTPFPQSLGIALSDERFLRSNVAHSFFEDERLRRPHLISASGLRSHAWCLGAGAAGCPCVALAVIARSGGKTLFLDPWIVRRERMETPARRYWDWRMAMRPWDVFLAQVLQFQCQLADGPTDAPPDVGPCEVERQALDAGVETLDATLKQIQDASPDQPPPFVKGLAELRAKFAELLKTQAGNAGASGAHILIDRGFDELPPAGWLPVVAGKIVQGQVRALMGAGVDLRFCVVRPDYIGHALEEAQHLERISLTEGLDDPKRLQEVDILVPNGVLFQTAPPPQPQTGKIAGRVLDVRGASQPGTTVTAQSLQGGTSLQTVTDSKSNFAFDDLAPGTWQVSATVAGIGTATQAVTVIANQTVSLDLVLGGTAVVGTHVVTNVVTNAPGGAVTVGRYEALQRPIIATLDWVFFHRRREKQCTGAPPAPTLTRKYRLLHFAQDFPIDQIKALLADPVAAPGFVKMWTSVATLEFDRSSAPLLTPTPADLLAAWKTSVPGQRLLLVALMATPGNDESQALEEQRGKLVVDIVRDGQPIDRLKGDVLADVPDAVRQNFNLAADEGFLFIESLVTDVAPPPPAPLQQHEVFLVNADQLKGAQLAVRNGTFGSNNVAPLERVGLVDFKDGTLDPTQGSFDAFVQRWRNLTNGAQVAAGLTVTTTGADAATRALLAKQGEFLADKLTLTGSVKAGAVATLPSSAPVLTLLLPGNPG